jgi:hypothetical protein
VLVRLLLYCMGDVIVLYGRGCCIVWVSLLYCMGEIVVVLYG